MPLKAVEKRKSLGKCVSGVSKCNEITTRLLTPAPVLPVVPLLLGDWERRGAGTSKAIPGVRQQRALLSAAAKWVLLTPGWGGGGLALIGNSEMLEWREDGFPGTRMEN